MAEPWAWNEDAVQAKEREALRMEQEAEDAAMLRSCRSRPPSGSATWSMEARANSHASVATVLRRIESQEREMQIPGPIPTVCSIARGVQDHTADSGKKEPQKQAGKRERVAKCNPWMKYLVWCAILTMSYAIWSHARYLV